MTTAATMARLARAAEAVADAGGIVPGIDRRHPQTITRPSQASPVMALERFDHSALTPAGHASDYRLVTLEELDAMPDPTYLVEGLLPEGGLTMLHGHPSAGKSLLALDWSLSIASGASSWMGRALRPGRVVYIAAEGRGGLKHRKDAWLARWGLTGQKPLLQFILGPVPLRDPFTADQLLDAIAGGEGRADPTLVVVDTLARCTAGADENSAADMGEAIGTLDRIRQETGCAVLFLHHNTKHSKGERGSTALRGAVDVALSITESDGTREVEVTKARDGDTDVRVRFQVHPQGESVVLVPESPPGPGDPMPRSVRATLKAFQDIYTGDPIRAADWKESSGHGGSTFHRAAADLIRREVIRRGKARGEYEPGRHFLGATSPGGGA